MRTLKNVDQSSFIMAELQTLAHDLCPCELPSQPACSHFYPHPWSFQSYRIAPKNDAMISHNASASSTPWWSNLQLIQMVPPYACRARTKVVNILQGQNFIVHNCLKSCHTSGQKIENEKNLILAVLAALYLPLVTDSLTHWLTDSLPL